MRTLLLILGIILLLIGGVWYRCGDKNGFSSTSESQVDDSKPIFSPDEICEMLSFTNADGKAGFLVQKGYKEKTITDYEKEPYGIWEKNYALFPLKNGIKIVIPTYLLESKSFDIVFDEDRKEEYLRFLSQFPQITAPFPKGNENQKETQHLVCSKNYVAAEGYLRDSKGYVVYCISYSNQ